MLFVKVDERPIISSCWLTSSSSSSSSLFVQSKTVFTSPAEAVAKYVLWCMSVCPRGYLRNHMRDLYQIFVHIACVRGSVLLGHVYDRPHRLSPGRGFLPHCKCIIGRERGWECTARAKYAIYDCLVFSCNYALWLNWIYFHITS